MSQAPRRLDPAAILAGVLTDLAILVPVVALYAVLRGVGVLGSDTGIVVTAVVAVLIAPVAGGFTAGRRQLQAPLTNGAAAAAVAVLAYVAFRVADASLRGSTIHPGSILVLVTLSVTLGLLGGYAGFRSARH